MTAPRALVVDDVRTNRSFLRALLEEDGFEVFEAGDGIEAVSMFRTVRPSVVLMDVMLPKLDGYAATRVIKELAGEELVTVIMVTSVSQDQVLRGIESGADDFLLRPFKPQALRARLAVWRRVRDLLAVVRGQRDELAAHEALAEAERERVVGIFRRIVGTTLPAGIDAVASPATIFNGDVVLAAETPSGQLRVLVGDFTGHGLTAAMGALPAAETFREATRAGMSIEELTIALDKRLQGFLPIGMFFAVALVELDFVARCARVVNLGMPPILFVSASTMLQFASTGPPLGIPIPMREVHASELGITADSVLVACTDGVVEAEDANGKQFEIEGVQRALHGVPPDKMVAALRDALRAHAPGAQNDDISFAVISPMVRGTSHMADSLEERLVWRLDAERLRDELMLPRMFEDIARAPWTTRFNGELQTVLAELYANSLDYGVLGLSSASKRNLATYGDYMMSRGAALDVLQEGTITIQLSRGSDGDSIVLEIEDSGAGFVPPIADEHSAEALAYIDPASPPSGRGIAMVQAIASEVTYSKEGRAVRVVLREAPTFRTNGGLAAQAPEQNISANAIAFEAVLSTANCAILVEDSNRDVICVNHMFCELFRLPDGPRKLVGRDGAGTMQSLMPSVADPDAFVVRIAELVAARAPVLHDEILFADGATCHRDYHPLSGGLHLWSYRPTAGIELLMPDQIDSREDAIDIDLRSRLELAHHGLERAQQKDPTDLVASLGFAAAFDGHRLVQLMEVTRSVWRQGHYEATPTTGDVNELAPHLASAVAESGVTVDLMVRVSGHITTWPKSIEGILNALVGGGCYSRCAEGDRGRVSARIDFTGGGVALGSVKAPRQWSNEEGETMRRVRSTVASLLVVRVGGGLEHEVDDGMDSWTFWVPATGSDAADDGDYLAGAVS